MECPGVGENTQQEVQGPSGAVFRKDDEPSKFLADVAEVNQNTGILRTPPPNIHYGMNHLLVAYPF